MKSLKPTKGVRPIMDGVPGELVELSAVPSSVIFGRCSKLSPYDPKLKELLEAGSGSVLCFGEPRARASLYSRAKKLGMKIEFGEHAGKLYVRLAPSSLPVAQYRIDGEPAKDASVRDTVAASARTRNQAGILSAIREGKNTPEAIAVWMREKENSNLDAPIVRSLLKHMQTAGTVKLAKITPERWELAA